MRSVVCGTNEIPTCDTGPTWVWPRWQPHVQRWLDALSVRPFPQWEQGDAILDGYGPQVVRQPLPGQDGIVRLHGGPGAIVEAVQDRLEPGTVHTGSEVVGIEPAEHGMRLRLNAGPTWECSVAIIATPLRVAHERIMIDALDSNVTRLMQRTSTWMGQQAKAVVVYPSPFWRARGLSGRVASRAGPLVEMHDHSPEDGAFGALFGFVGWSAQDRARDPSVLRAAILEQLVRCFGPEASDPQQLVLQDWAKEPLICSQLDLRAPPEHPTVGPDVLRQGHLDNRLWFAVSETSDVSPGLIEGALVAGERIAERVLACR